MLSAQNVSIAETSRKLRTIKVTDDPMVDLPYDVPDDVRPLLRQFKGEIRNLISSSLDTLGDTATPEKVQDSLTRQLNEAHVMVRTSPKDEPEDFVSYGLIQNIRVGRPDDQANLLVVVVTLQIPCGNDSLLYVFRKKSPRWSLVLAHEASDYKQVDGALGSLRYALSGTRRGASWYLVETWTNPWCTSVWHSIHYRALRPGRTPDQPEVLFESEHGSNISYQATVHASPNSFEVRFADYQLLDFDVWIREHIQTYDMRQIPPRRIAPLGLKPEDFLDEWVSLPWEEALRWVSATDQGNLQRWHDQLHAVTGSGHDSISIGFVQPCGQIGSLGKWQVSLTVNEGKGTDSLPGNVYVTISSRGKEDYLVTTVVATRPEACPGETKPTPDSMDLSEY